MIRIGNRLFNPTQITRAELDSQGGVNVYFTDHLVAEELTGDEAKAFWTYYTDGTVDLLEGQRLARERAERIASYDASLKAKYGEEALF